MRGLLQVSNIDLLREVERAWRALEAARAVIPPELEGYCDWAEKVCEEIRQAVRNNLADIALGIDEILVDILSATQETTRSFHVFNQRFLSGVLRFQLSDRLCLRLLKWLHSEHAVTRDSPMSIGDGEFSIWPAQDTPVLYAMPPSAQRGLLYLPLFFHEFGHLLYKHHEPEMDDLVKNLQRAIADRLLAGTQRGDDYDLSDLVYRKTIVETWFEWTQEIFCDAVGYTIGGPAFANAFAVYMRMRGRGEYHAERDELALCSHPVTWLRIKLIADRARQSGAGPEADELERSWAVIAAALGVTEDYYGYFEQTFLDDVRQTVTDMLTEAGPRELRQEELGSSDTDAPSNSPPHLLNQSWRRFLRDPGRYAAWEDLAIRGFLEKQ